MRRTDPPAAIALLALVAVVACAKSSNAPPPAPVLSASVASSWASSSASPTSVIGLYERACDGGSGDGCNNLALVYFEGRAGAKKDAKRARTFFQRSCDLGAAGGCGNLGYLLHAGEGGPRDEVRAIGLLTQACDGSFWESCYWLGDIYYGGEHEDRPMALSVLERACKGGHLQSCASQGVLLADGKGGVSKDALQAAKLLQRACEGKVHFACTGLASLFLHGDGVAADADRARKLYDQGCADDYPGGCYAYGAVCASGALGDQCSADALLRRACDLGHANACSALATLMEQRTEKP